MKAVAVVGARLNSSRLPGKHLLDLAGKPMIARIFERLDKVPSLNGAVLATTNDPYNQPLVAWAQAQGRQVLAYEGDVNDLVGRVDHAFRATASEVLVYICGDCPLIDPRLIEHMLQALAAAPQAQYVQVKGRAGRGVIHQGIDIFRADLWQRIVVNSRSASEREHVGSARHKFLAEIPYCSWEEPEIFHRSQQRISVDTPSDYRFMREIYQRWYRDRPIETVVSLSWVIEQLIKDPELAAINAAVHQKAVNEVSQPVILACAASVQLGLGHLRRMLVLAKALVDGHAAGATLLIEGEAPPLEDLQLTPHTCCAELFAGLEKLMATKKPEAVVFDLPSSRLEKAKPKLAALREQGIDLISVDGAIPWPDLYRLDYVPSFYMAPERETERRFWGWQRYLLPEAPAARATIPRLLVLTGGSDAYNLGHSWPQMLDSCLPEELEILWIQGPFSAPPKLPEPARLRWQLCPNPENLQGIMSGCGYALSVYGVGLFECLALGLPCVAWMPSILDPGEALAFTSAGVALSTPDPSMAVQALVTLIQDLPLATALAQTARQRVQPKGAAELAALILAPPQCM